MFAYSDPTGTDGLERAGALAFFREKVDRWYTVYALEPGSAFTRLEAFDEATPDQVSIATVEWNAFPPRFANTHSRDEIDRDRFRLHEEYCEWRTERGPGGEAVGITFTTEFFEYFGALAAAGADALKDEITGLIPGATPSDEDLFGPGFNPAQASAEERFDRFEQMRRRNPWNDGRKGILCMGSGPNTLSALCDLLGFCGKVMDVPAEDACAGVAPDGHCVPGRNSDPKACSAAQNIVRAGSSFTLADPAGIRILGLGGLWALDDTLLDIENPAANQGLWQVSRNSRRGVLTVRPGLTLDGSSITSGADVAAVLRVGVDVKVAPDTALPLWARTGRERLRTG